MLLGREKTIYLRSRRRNKLGSFLILLGIGVTAVYFLYGTLILSREKPLISPVSGQMKAEMLGIADSNQVNLKNAVENVLAGTKGTYAVAIKNLKTGESYFANEHKSFEAGSLYKLWVMAAVLSKIRDGTLSEEQVLSRDISALNEVFGIDSEVAELTEGKIALSVNDALTQMITISHNYAALLLTEKIKLSTVANLLKEKGFGESKVGRGDDVPHTTPYDIFLYFEKLYKGELAQPEDTEKMLVLLKNQKLNGKLPKNLPKDTVIAHKTGEIGWFTHDAGIIYSDKGDYIIVAMSETDKPAAAEERIARISESVYRYFTKF
ncbi:MAG: Beta-lactamase [Candidatus Daviesbacteria bacterium GW2011_GWF2_38_7]|nr:MAG: Beta-lactamase [Candidatus Daviesbacteria bacterium GW2011_GWF2_38_7]